jgi:hypothetical protein
MDEKENNFDNTAGQTHLGLKQDFFKIALVPTSQ